MWAKLKPYNGKVGGIYSNECTLRVSLLTDIHIQRFTRFRLKQMLCSNNFIFMFLILNFSAEKNQKNLSKLKEIGSVNV
jgi:hypothetical protein